MSGITNTKQVPRLLTAKEAEELRKIDVKTLYGYVQRGLLPAHVLFEDTGNGKAKAAHKS